MICLTRSVSSSAIPCSPMLNDASLVLPSYLQESARQSALSKRAQTENHSQHFSDPVAAAVSSKPTYAPDDRGEVASYLGFDERFVERGVWSRHHQGGEQAEDESFKRISDAEEEKRGEEIRT